MTIDFDSNLASALQSFVDKLRSDVRLKTTFVQSPTETVVSHLEIMKVGIPKMFHAHAVHRGNPLPEEPRLATIERNVYIFRKDGLFEYKRVPGSPDGDDAVLTNIQLGACACCNCCAVEV